MGGAARHTSAASVEHLLYILPVNSQGMVSRSLSVTPKNCSASRASTVSCGQRRGRASISCATSTDGISSFCEWGEGRGQGRAEEVEYDARAL